jgi:hypothetical protein
LGGFENLDTAKGFDEKALVFCTQDNHVAGFMTQCWEEKQVDKCDDDKGGERSESEFPAIKEHKAQGNQRDKKLAG